MIEMAKSLGIQQSAVTFELTMRRRSIFRAGGPVPVRSVRTKTLRYLLLFQVRFACPRACTGVLRRQRLGERKSTEQQPSPRGRRDEEFASDPTLSRRCGLSPPRCETQKWACPCGARAWRDRALQHS